MNDYKEKLEKRIAQLMKGYGIRESDIKIGSAGQIRGYIMGLREALTLYEDTEKVSEYVTVDVSEQSGETGSRRTISTRRSRTTR